MNRTRDPAETTSSFGLRTPAAEMINWFGLSPGEGPPGLPPPPPPQVAVRQAIVTNSTPRRVRTLELEPGGNGHGTVRHLDTVAAIPVDVLQSMRITAVEHERSELDPAADRQAEVRTFDVLADVHLLRGSAELHARPRPH